MPQLGFMRHMAPKVLAGTKPFTLRNLRLDGRDPKVGQTLYMFTDLRQETCKKFAEKPCRFAATVKLSVRSIKIPGLGEVKTTAQLKVFSQLDGFDTHAEFLKYHHIRAAGDIKTMRIIAWVTRDELKALIGL